MYKTYKIKTNYDTYIISSISVKGREKQENQDRFFVKQRENKIVCVLCDGLGSAQYSAIGATYATELGSELLLKTTGYDNFSKVFRKLWKEKVGIESEKFDTTFKFFLIDENELIYGGIGDGWLKGVIDGEFFEVASQDNFANQTESIMTVGYIDKFKVYRKSFSKIQYLSLATDGFSEDMDEKVVNEFLLESINEMRVNNDKFSNQLEKSIEKWPIKTNVDDKSIIIIGSEKDE